MAGKHSADDDFNPYRHQSNRQNEENIKRNSKENYVAESYNKTGSNRGVNSNSKVSNGNTNRTIKGKTGEVEDVERRKRVSKGNTKKKHKGLKIFAIFLLVIAIIVLLVAGGAFYFINDKIGKIFDVDNDMAELGKKIDEIQRVKLSKNEADALFIFRYCSRTMQILNEVKKNSDLTEKQLKEIEKELKQLKKSFKADLKNINLTEFDVFGDILSNEKDNISINNVRHRESKKDKYRILNISKEITLEDFIDNVRNYLKLIKEVLNKIKTNSNLSIYKLSNKKIELENLNIFNINPKNEFKDVDFSKSKEVYLYKVNIKENTPVAFYTNYVFYDNFNKTLPIGMDISTEILFDTFKSKIKETKHEEFNINVYEDEYTSKVLKVNVIEYEGKEYN